MGDMSKNHFWRFPVRKVLLTFMILACAAGLLGFSGQAVAAEVKGSTITVETVPGQTLTQIVTNRAEHSWPWYVTRASGLVAGISLVALMLSGIGSVTGHFFRLLEPITAWATHRALGITFVAAIVVHMVTLIFDKFTPFSIIHVLLPWASNYKPVSIFGVNIGSAFVALGVLAFYGSIIVLITSLLWVDKKPHLWKFIHYVSYGVIAAVFVHALYLGTDAGHGIGRVLWILGGVAILTAIILRLRRARTS